ncbi:MAG: glutaminyl-peptide cyclotransferase [Luteolibacter sp.]
MLLLSGVACKENPEPPNAPVEVADDNSAPDWKTHKWSGFEVVRELPHDAEAFTQGLLLSRGDWIESTGGFGTTSIRCVEKETGKVLLKKDLEENFFGEGLAELDGKFYQLTWQSQKGFIYDAKTLKRLGDFAYRGEGWGLTTDGQSLIMSDGSDRLRFLDPKTFRVWREVSVRLDGKPVRMLNELEFIEGEIFANVWHTEKIVRINPVDGNIVGVIDLTGIFPLEGRLDPEHVLNGIAYDAATQELFVTGKCWPKIYQIRLVRRR